MRIGRGSLVAVGALVLLSACAPVSATQSTALVVEEHALHSAPEMEPLAFDPVEGSMAEILALHAAWREKYVAQESLLIDGESAMRARMGTDEFIATERYDAENASTWVGVRRGGQEIYRIQTGMPSPVSGLRGLWISEGHWVLETTYSEPDSYMGSLTVDGALTVPGGQKQEAFDFQVLHNRPFYFFRTDHGIGLSFDGMDLSVTYDEVPHYQCCSASALNPRHSEDMLTFFARRGVTWYYVEAGLFD